MVPFCVTMHKCVPVSLVPLVKLCTHHLKTSVVGVLVQVELSLCVC